MKELRILLFGASGRMGAEIISLVENDLSASVVAGVVAEEDPGAAERLSRLSVPCLVDWRESAAESNIVVDFSLPDGTKKAIEAASSLGLPLISGTTSLGEEIEVQLRELALEVPVLAASNFSLGMNSLYVLTKAAAELLWDKGFDTEILECHHRMKADAPSGSALELARCLAGEDAGGGGEGLAGEALNMGRSGRTGVRPEGEIGIQAVRGGDVAGEHTVFFLGEGERLELTHRAGSRSIFARGAMHAARWLIDKEPGFFTMEEVLGE